jgi:hypothetical protein
MDGFSKVVFSRLSDYLDHPVVVGLLNVCVSRFPFSHHLSRKDTFHEVDSQINVPTSPTPSPSQLLCFHFVCSLKEVSDLISLPVVNLLDTRVVGTSIDVVTQITYLELLGRLPSSST